MTKFWDTAKSVGGFVVGAAAAKVTTAVIEKCATPHVEVALRAGCVCSRETLPIPRNYLERIVFAVGTFAIAGTVGAIVGSHARREIGDLEEIINEISADINKAMEEGTNV